MSNELYDTYLRYLSEWIPFSRKHFYRLPDHPELACYGTGFDEWGIQTNQKAFAGYAVLADDPNTDEKLCGICRQELLKDALCMLRYTLRTHITGDVPCGDNKHWGHTWLTSVGTERMMHGVDCIWNEMTKEDHALLRKVLISESDWLLEHYPVLAGRVENNRPESNIWNGCIMARTAIYYPDAPNAAQYAEKSLVFLANGLSVDYDAASTDEYDGKRLRDLYKGDNFFRSWALGHHHYMNVGYIVISLSQIAMMHYACKSRGLEAPALLYRHIENIWQLVRLTTFPDGRLFRTGGDNRVRYCYCQDYCVPMWIFMGDVFGDPDCTAWEYQWLEKVKQERDANGDGSFLSARCGGLDEISPLYYTRLEADRACSMSFGVYWHRLIGKACEKPQLPYPASTGDWQDEYHGAILIKSEKRTASWVWRAGELPTGICVPTYSSDLAEWRENLAGSVSGFGAENYSEVVTHTERRFEGGFVTCGIVAACSDEFAAEGQLKEVLTYKNLACAALPDDESMVVLQYARADLRCYLTSLKGIHLNIPNDVFNGFERTYYTVHGATRLRGAQTTETILNMNSDWVNVDDKLSLVNIYGGDLKLYRPDHRQIGIKKDIAVEGNGSGDIGMLYCDELCAPVRHERFACDRGTPLLDNGFVVMAGVRHEKTAAYAKENNVTRLSFGTEKALRGVLVRGADGVRYALLANFDDSFINAHFNAPGTAAAVCIPMIGKSAVLLSEEKGWKAL